MKKNKRAFSLMVISIAILLVLGTGLQGSGLAWATLAEGPGDNEVGSPVGQDPGEPGSPVGGSGDVGDESGDPEGGSEDLEGEFDPGNPDDPLPPGPGLTVSIEADREQYRPGETANFMVTVTNSGQADLADLKVQDSLTGLEETIAYLAAGENWTCEITCDIPADFTGAELANSVYVYGIYEDREVGAEATATVKVSPDAGVDPGDPDPGLVPDIGSGLQSAVLSATSYTDTIEVNKSAVRTQGCRAYEVILGITGTPPPEKPVDVILVIDCSNSMDYGDPSSLYYAKQAAKELAGQVLQNTANRVAVVSFAFKGVWSWWPFGYVGDLKADTSININFSNNLTQVKSAIDGLSTYGGTNTEAGFIQARNLMTDDGRETANKTIVFLTDGVPTVSIGRIYGPSEPTSHNDHTIAAYTAGQSCHSLGYQVFTVNLLSQVPEKCLAVARDTMQKAQNAGYYETLSAPDLSDIYSQISQQLNYSATNAVVTDRIPTDEFEFVSFGDATQGSVSYDGGTGIITWNAGTIGTGAIMSYKIRARADFEGGTDVPTNDYAALTYTDINGNPGQTQTFPVPKVDVPGPLTVNAGPDRQVALGSSIGIGDNLTVTGGTEPYTYLWTCATDSGWSSTESNPTVSPTEDTTYTVTVTDNYGCSKSDGVAVTVLKGTITVNKVVQTGSTDKKFAIYVEGEGHTWTMLLAHGQSATIAGLGPGTYTIREVVPMDYELVSISPLTIVTIGPDSTDRNVTVTNKKVNDSWFRDDDEKTNTFKLGFWSQD